jgi:hypothetical protein
MISLLFGVGYGEIIWNGVSKGRTSIKEAKTFIWFMAILNFIVALVAGSITNLEISIVILNYALVIFNLREEKMKGDSKK